jgi:hypothetical protein
MIIKNPKFKNFSMKYFSWRRKKEALFQDVPTKNTFFNHKICAGSSAHSRVALDPDPPAEPVGGDGGAAAGDADDDDAGAAQHGRHDDHGGADAAAAHADGDERGLRTLVGGWRRHHPRRQESARPADPGRAPAARLRSLLHTQPAKRVKCFAGGVARWRREIAVEFGLGDREQ